MSKINIGSICKEIGNMSRIQRLVGLLGVFLVVGGFIMLLPKAFAAPTPVKSITIESSKLDYSKKEPGSYNIEKSAKWIEKGKARITFDLDTVMKSEKKHTDIIFVLDVSGSMEGDKLNRVKQDSIELINTLLSDSNNRAALITFETVSKLMISLTNNKEELVSTINGLTTGNTTNYYQALLNVNEILKDYEKKEDRDCIVLFLTDGYPNEDVPNEEGEYSYLKKAYPYITINGIQYEMGSEVLTPVKKVSDQQFIADMTNLNNVLFEASVSADTYDSFSITDYINNDYFEIESVDSISSTVGTTKLEYEGSVPKVIWDIENFRSGGKATLTIDVNLKKEYIDKGGLYPTNKKEEVKSKIDEVIDDIVSTKTPILSSHYQVIYDANIPDGCRLLEEVPKTETKEVFDVVEISNQKLICDNYQFKGWTIINKNVKKINDDFFEMPSNDVFIKAKWGRVSVDKNVDGEVYVAPPSVIKKVDWRQNSEIWKYKYSITKVVFETNISDKEGATETFDISDKKNGSVIGHIVLNDDLSTYTAYIQGNGKIIANQDSSYLFSEFSHLLSIEGLEYLDTSQATKMSHMFYGLSYVTNIDLHNFDTSNVTDMNRMFYGCRNLTSLDLSNFDTSRVTDMSSMLAGCRRLKALDLSLFDTKNVTDMDGMFSNCANLTSLDLSGFNTGKVTNMASMFNECSSLTSLDLSNFDTSRVTDMSKMFSLCSSLVSLDISNFDTRNVINMESMFYKASKLKEIDVSGFGTGKVTKMVRMFGSCSSLTSLDLSGFDTSKVTTMVEMFYSCSHLTSLDLSAFDTSSVTDMSYMFSYCSNLTNLNLSDFNTKQVTDMESMFSYCRSLISLDLSSFDTSKVTRMSRMFASCSSLTSLNLNSFSTSLITDMSYMFSYCRSLISLDLSSFDTSRVTSMMFMFNGCSSLINLDLSNFDTGYVTIMSSMFNGCSSLTSLNLSSFDTSKVTTMAAMFSGCISLSGLDLTNFDMSQVTNMSSMFKGCSKITTTLTVMNTSVTSYDKMFEDSATVDGSQITVNYTSGTSDLVDKMIATKSSNSNVVKGELVTI